MKYTFTVEETLAKDVTINADNLGEAIVDFFKKYNNQEIVLAGDDFVAGELKLHFGGDNPYVSLEDCFEPVEDSGDYAIIIHQW